jgi:selenocysteine-specific elongation factor
VILAEQFARAREQITKFIRDKGKATASELRQHLNTNRRVIIPLLERLDKEGVTVRQGDYRLLKKPPG